MQYDNLSKEELLKLIKKQELDLKSKKYGLVWDDEKETEQVVLDCRDNLPVLRRIKGKEIKEPKNNTQEDNILIEGDNYHALTVLNYTHQEKIDVIYIDPPYNTGKKDEWKYNDNYVDENDGYRHSKWLNFMEKRLKLAKNLLKSDGVIFISIDDHEQAQVRLLCDKIFGENNFINNFMWLHGKGKKTKQSRTLQQYNLCYAKNKHMLQEWVDYKFASGTFSNPDSDLRGPWFSGSISFSEERSNKHHQNYFEIKSPSGKKWVRQWQCSREEMEEYLKDNRIYFGTSPDYTNVPRLKIFPSDSKEIIPGNILDNYGTTKGAQKILDQIIFKNKDGKTKFENPKPVELIKYFINILNKSKKIYILDFFAGSGTTGHAILELNKEDGGNRKFILCTNNENNICSEVTYPRIEKVIKGYINSKKEKIKGLNGNLQYFKTSLIQTTKNRDQNKINLTQKCTEMLCLKENIFNIEIEKEDFKIFSSNKKDKFLCVYYNFIEESFGEFLKEIKKLKGEKIIYMFSLEDKIDKSLFKDIKNCKLEAIPKKILEIYKKLVKMNIPIKVETIFIDLEKAKKQIFEDKDKDTGAKTLRVVLEKLVQKIAQKNQINILTDKGKEIKLSTLNDTLKSESVFTKVEWEENKIYLTIGNNASHGEYDEFDLTQVNKFYKHIQNLINKFNI